MKVRNALMHHVDAKLLASPQRFQTTFPKYTLSRTHASRTLLDRTTTIVSIWSWLHMSIHCVHQVKWLLHQHVFDSVSV